MSVPTRSPAQRRAALARASATRHQRARVLAQLQAAQVTFAELLHQAEADPVVGTTKVARAVRSARGIGAGTAEQLMRDCRIAPTRTLMGLGSRQRHALLTRVP